MWTTSLWKSIIPWCAFFFVYTLDVTGVHGTTPALRCNWDSVNVTTVRRQGSSGNRKIEEPVPVFWINMAESLGRRNYMNTLLSSPAARAMGLGSHYRVEAITPEAPSFNISHLEMPCKRNTPRDLAVILSHLTAIHRAVYDVSTEGRRSKYALVLEDDVVFTLPIDISRLVASAPPGFGLLQLTTSCREAVHLIWRRFLRSGGEDLWTLNHWTNTTRDKRYPLFWSAQAYLVNKAVVRHFLDDVVTAESNGSLSFKIINSFFPKNCKRSRTRPCILANCLFSDSYIFAGAGPTFVSNVPIVNGADIGRTSTVHQEHVERVHLPVFDLIRQIINTLKERYENTMLGPAMQQGTSSVLPRYVVGPECTK